MKPDLHNLISTSKDDSSNDPKRISKNQNPFLENVHHVISLPFESQETNK